MLSRVRSWFTGKIYSYKYKFNWIGIFTSPFKAPKIWCHIGKVRVGFPYFLPRRLNKDRKFVRKKIGFSACGLGYKTKWTENDYRHEWDPCYGFVFCGLQIAITFHLHTAIWESWLLYNHFRNLGMSKEDSLASAREVNPNVWVSGDGVKTDYFLKGLRKYWYDRFRTADAISGDT